MDFNTIGQFLDKYGFAAAFSIYFIAEGRGLLVKMINGVNKLSTKIEKLTAITIGIVAKDNPEAAAQLRDVLSSDDNAAVVVSEGGNK